MKLERLAGERFKEKPAESVFESHALMVRGGYIKFMASGIYSLYTPMKRIAQKIEAILREEMDAIDCQEVMFPVVLPGSLWEESGRFESVGSELMRMKDRNGTSMILGMTHEEASVHLVREFGQTYTKYPILIYQIQTKFRDEPRPRGGLIRVREFTMKDAYSFHTSQEDLELFYNKCYAAYNRIFARAGVPEVITVQSDSGMMGGKVAHEYMLLSDMGEDSLAVCSECDFRANMEAAESIVDNSGESILGKAELTLVETPGIATIDEVCAFLKLPVENSCKAVVYRKNRTDEYVVAFIRGDLEVNDIKLKNFLGDEIYPAEIEEGSGLFAGSIGPVNLPDNIIAVLDRSLEGIQNLCCGANIDEHHYTGMNIPRDVKNAVFTDIAKVTEGGICPGCGKHSLTLKRGIEVGNIFQLGTRYSESMGMQYTDSEGELHYPIMGSYGIGVGRLAASICEAHHDDYGPVWPITVAPWQVHLCCLRSDDESARKCADDLYSALQSEGIEVIYDDRAVRAGVMFSDADLLGVPVRVIVSPKNVEAGVFEVTTRDKSFKAEIAADSIVSEVKGLIKKLTDEVNSKVPVQ